MWAVRGITERSSGGRWSLVIRDKDQGGKTTVVRFEDEE
jgi:hypothetical protein